MLMVVTKSWKFVRENRNCNRDLKLEVSLSENGIQMKNPFARKINDEPSNEERKVLDTIWDPDEDLLKINLSVPESQGPTTK